MGAIKATKDGSIAISNVYEQESADTDWVDNTPSIDYKLPEITVESDSTSTELNSVDVLVENDLVRVYNGTDGLVDGSLGAVTATDVSAAGAQTLGNIGTHLVLSNNDLTVTKDSTNGNADSTVYSASPSQDSKITWKITMDTNYIERLGVSTQNTYQSEKFVNTSGGYGYQASGNKIDSAGTNEAYGSSFAEGDVILVEYTPQTGDIVFYKNDISQGVAFTITPNTAVYLACTIFMADASATIETLEQTTKYTADISSLSLTEAPAKVYKDTSVTVSTSTVPTGDPDSFIVGTEVSDTYNDTTSTFTKTYDAIQQQGRSFKYKIEADLSVEIDKITVLMNKQP